MAGPENQRWLENGEKTRRMGMDMGKRRLGVDDPENQRWLEKGEKTRWMGMDTGEVAVGNVSWSDC